jgi:hypothetical protein
MGRQVNIVTHGQPKELRITGRNRPVELGPVEIRATVDGSEVASYRIGQPDTEMLKVPASASVTLTASATFCEGIFLAIHCRAGSLPFRSTLFQAVSRKMRPPTDVSRRPGRTSQARVPDCTGLLPPAWGLLR